MSLGDYIKGADLYSRQVAQVIDQCSLISCGTATGSVNAFVLDLSLVNDVPQPVRLLNGATYSFIPNLTTTSTTVTVQISAKIGAKSIKKANGTSALAVGAIVLGYPTVIQWDSTNSVFRLLLDSSVTGTALGSILNLDCGTSAAHPTSLITVDCGGA